MKIQSAAMILAFIAAPLLSRADDMTMDMGNGAADKAFAQSMRNMMKAMATKPTGDADKDFVAMMMPHHQGAIDMAIVELQYGKDPMLRKLAGEIVVAQEKEIVQTKAWQAAHAK